MYFKYLFEASFIFFKKVEKCQKFWIINLNLKKTVKLSNKFKEKNVFEIEEIKIFKDLTINIFADEIMRSDFYY